MQTPITLTPVQAKHLDIVHSKKWTIIKDKRLRSLLLAHGARVLPFRELGLIMKCTEVLRKEYNAGGLVSKR